MPHLRNSLLLGTLLTSPVWAQERQLGAHEHGVAEMTIAVADSGIEIELRAPGADIVGFEYAATSEADLAAIEAALEALSEPLSLFGIPPAAGCDVVEVEAELETEEGHDHGDEHDHDHDEHAEEDADHDDHDHGDHDDHDHGDHDDHDDHDHGDEAAEAGHTEFHAHYTLSCADVSAFTTLTLGYFTTFPNAQEVTIEMVTETGVGLFEASRAAPEVDLSSAF